MAYRPVAVCVVVERKHHSSEVCRDLFSLGDQKEVLVAEVRAKVDR